MKLPMKSLGLGAAFLIAASAAHAATPAVTTDPLNLRAGPGPGYAVSSVLDAGAPVSVLGCIDNTNWCRVDASGSVGYVYSEYLNIGTPTAAVTLGNTWKTVGIMTEVHNDNGVAVSAADPSGVLAGRDAVALGDSSNSDRLEPTEVWTTYVISNPVSPVYLDGEVMMGVGIPEDVTLYEVPESEYRYVTINDRTVLVEPTSRRIMYIYE
ncbi:MAG: DUF1236 domain-containing protein [Gemmobacter sp.]|nr:DUF1236 domain-containing protein [Gemmobacter sp.]